MGRVRSTRPAQASHQRARSLAPRSYVQPEGASEFSRPSGRNLSCEQRSSPLEEQALKLEGLQRSLQDRAAGRVNDRILRIGRVSRQKEQRQQGSAWRDHHPRRKKRALTIERSTPAYPTSSTGPAPRSRSCQQEP